MLSTSCSKTAARVQRKPHPGKLITIRLALFARAVLLISEDLRNGRSPNCYYHNHCVCFG
jgi:hypothetical protein